MQVIRLVDEVGIDSAVRGKTFENALVIGPAVIALLGGVVMERCGFEGTEESLFIEVEDGRFVTGVVAVIDTTFRDCRFQNISILGTKENLDTMRKILAENTAAAMASQERQQPPVAQAAEPQPPAAE